jgi:hypothetical protein
MTGPVVRRWEARIAGADVQRWCDTFGWCALPVMPDFMRPFFPEYDAAASFHDEIFQEATP